MAHSFATHAYAADVPSMKLVGQVSNFRLLIPVCTTQYKRQRGWLSNLLYVMGWRRQARATPKLRFSSFFALKFAV
jgi:hypothetical protein